MPKTRLIPEIHGKALLRLVVAELTQKPGTCARARSRLEQ